MAKWLIKSEPETFSIDDFQKSKVTAWDGVRNYQARNFLKEMKVGEDVLFYHSNDNPPGIVGLGKVCKTAYPEANQFDKKSKYFDETASKGNPRWFSPDLKFVEKFKKQLALPDLKKEKGLSEMVLLKKGSRLSVQPVSEAEFKLILSICQKTDT